jgi:hypothetical protein
VTAALLALLLAAPAAAERQQRFLEILRTYPQRPPEESLQLVEALVDQGPFEERDRALYWLGSVRLTARDPAGARRPFARLRAEHPGSIWVERADLGEGDASAQERDYGAALRWYERAAQARDPAVRELSRLSTTQVLVLRARQRWAMAAGAFALLVLALLCASIARRWPVALLPLPAEARVLWPVLAVMALLSLRQDPAPRAAVLQLCAAGALFTLLSGWRTRAAQPGPAGRAVQALGTLAALIATLYVAVWRADLVGMVLETLRAGPE